MAKSSMNKHLEKYLKAREELMVKIGRYVLNTADVETLKEFKQKYVVLSVEDEDVKLLLSKRGVESKKVEPESVNIDTLSNLLP